MANHTFKTFKKTGPFFYFIFFKVMSYYFEESTSTCIIYVGDETGLVTSFNFLQSKVGLLRRKHNDKLNVYYWIVRCFHRYIFCFFFYLLLLILQEIPNEREFIVVKNLYKPHNEMIRKIQYLPEEKVLITCSRDAKNSVVIKSLIQKRNPYIFKMRRVSNYFLAASFPKTLFILKYSG